MEGAKRNYIKINEGKTKIIYQSEEDKDLVVICSKDRITAGDGARCNDLQGKAKISNETASNIFILLNNAGIKTHFVRKLSSMEFLAHKCEMLPIEFVIRRIATGSFLKRNQGVEEGYKFFPPKQEYFFKDDENHDPQWSREQLICNFKKREFGSSNKNISSTDIDIIDRTTRTVFEILEKYWSWANCQLVDMKVEYGFNEKTGEILLADIIDSDSWRLWPQGDKKLMVDKQVYRDLKVVTDGDLSTVLKNFTWVSEKIKEFVDMKKCNRVIIIMGSPTDCDFCKEIQKYCRNFEIDCEMRVASAHKQASVVQNIVDQYEGDGCRSVFIAVAGRSNGLGPVLAGLTTCPVINCPPVQASWAAQDIWSSLRLPSGLGCSTVLGAEAAALAAAQMLALDDVQLWTRLKVRKINESVRLLKEDLKLVRERVDVP